MADFDDILAEQKKTNELLSKQKSPPSDKTTELLKGIEEGVKSRGEGTDDGEPAKPKGADKALLDSQRETTEAVIEGAPRTGGASNEDLLESQREITDAVKSGAEQTAEDYIKQSGLEVFAEYDTFRRQKKFEVDEDEHGRDDDHFKKLEGFDAVFGDQNEEQIQILKRIQAAQEAALGAYGPQGSQPTSVTGAAAEEDEKDRKANQDKRFTKLGIVFKKQIKGLGGALKALGVVKTGLLAGLTAIGFFALANFLESDTWKKLRKIIVEDFPPLLDMLYKDYILPSYVFFKTTFVDFWEDLKIFYELPTWKGLGTLIGENVVALGILAALISPALITVPLIAAWGLIVSAVTGLVAALAPILIPIAAVVIFAGGLLTIALALREGIEAFTTELENGQGIWVAIGSALSVFFVELFKIPTEFIAGLIPKGWKDTASMYAVDVMMATTDFFSSFTDAIFPEGFKEKFSMWAGDTMDKVFGFFGAIWDVINPFKWVKESREREEKKRQERLKAMSELYGSVGEFFGKLFGPFIRATAAFKAAGGGFRAIVPAMKAFARIPEPAPEPPAKFVDPALAGGKGVGGGFDPITGERISPQAEALRRAKLEMESREKDAVAGSTTTVVQDLSSKLNQQSINNVETRIGDQDMSGAVAPGPL